MATPGFKGLVHYTNERKRSVLAKGIMYAKIGELNNSVNLENSWEDIEDSMLGV